MKSKRQFGKDFTSGSIPRHLVQFALPILIGNLLATGYSVINIIWIGRLLGTEAVAAAAVSLPIFLAMVALSSGATLATSILVSRAYGAGDHKKIQQVVNNSWSVALIAIVLVTASGLLFADTLLRLLSTPAEIMGIASGYLKLTMLSFAFMYMSYLIASVLRGIGDTTIPLMFIVLSTVVNAVLDPLLIIGFGPIPSLGLNGAAGASILATGISVVLGFLYVRYKYREGPINPTRLLFERAIIMDIMRIGLPSFVQQMLVSLGYAVITIFVNGFGAAATAAFGVAGRIDSIVAMPAIAVMMAASTLTAQNLGAGKADRLKHILGWGILINIPVIAAISLLCVTFPEAILQVFVKDEDVVSKGVEYLRLVGFGYLFFIVFYVSNGIINGAGKTISTMIISLISLCLVRIPLAAWLSNTELGIRGVWLAIVLSFAVTTAASLLYYFSGKWLKGVTAVHDKQGEEHPLSTTSD
ncbi:MATE family efflux transporter [Paenibacillus chartarius]|uniref:MATE family efflux transporter n=1 Tax=Paenibacillus chartarius TaxID=747481 RepID=A0ABV6DV92_9BACL